MNKSTLHPIVFSGELQKSLDWFAKLGFSKLFEVKCPTGKPVHALLSRDGCEIMVGQTPPGGEFKAPSGSVLLYQNIGTDGAELDALCEELKAKGIQVSSEPTDQYWGSRTFDATHPEGLVFTFAAHTQQLSPEQITENLKEIVQATA